MFESTAEALNALDHRNPTEGRAKSWDLIGTADNSTRAGSTFR
jgi:hypothetical protein